jgi:hypothetical protein
MSRRGKSIHRKHIGGAQGPREGAWQTLLKEFKVSFEGNKEVLELDSGSICTGL